MARRSLILMLVVTLLVPGCGTTSPEVIGKNEGNAVWQARPPREYPLHDWVKEHPGVLVVGAVVLVAVAVVAVGFCVAVARAQMLGSMH